MQLIDVYMISDRFAAENTPAGSVQAAWRPIWVGETEGGGLLNGRLQIQIAKCKSDLVGREILLINPAAAQDTFSVVANDRLARGDAVLRLIEFDLQTVIIEDRCRRRLRAAVVANLSQASESL